MTWLVILACGDNNKDSQGGAVTDTSTDEGTTNPTTTGTTNPGITDPGTTPTPAVDADQDGFDDTIDCNDNEADIHPDADEVCDGVDNNCDGTIDDDAIDRQTFYTDVDTDGFGDAKSPVQACSQPKGAVSDDQDCDDNNLEIHPDAEELCDEVDNNCDGSIDTDATDRTAFYTDADGDSYGDPETAALACDKPVGTTTNADDCDDSDKAIHPAATEVVCDSLDNDCSGTIDDGWVHVPGTYTTLYNAFDTEGVSAQVCLAAGTHSESTGLYNLEGARIRGQGQGVTTWQGSSGATLYATGDLTIENMTLNGTANARAVTSNNGSVTLIDIEGTEAGCTSDCIGVWARAYSNGHIIAQGLELHDISVSVSSRLDGLIGTYSSSDSVTLEDFYIHDNTILTSDYMWGGIVMARDELTLTNGVVENNTVAGINVYGMVWATDQVQQDVDWINNTVEGDGYSYLSYQNGSSADWTRVRFLGNAVDLTTGSAAGGFFANGDFHFENVVMAGNSTTHDTGSGSFYGWLATSNASSATLQNVDIAYNDTDADYVNSAGVWLNTNTTSGTWLVSNTNIVDNEAPNMINLYAWALDVSETSRGSLEYSNLTGAGTWLTRVGTSGSTIPDAYTSVDPAYESLVGDPADWDLHLSSGSSLIDAGDPNLDDLDGSQSDVGAYGGPNGW